MAGPRLGLEFALYSELESQKPEVEPTCEALGLQLGPRQAWQSELGLCCPVLEQVRRGAPKPGQEVGPWSTQEPELGFGV